MMLLPPISDKQTLELLLFVISIFELYLLDTLAIATSTNVVVTSFDRFQNVQSEPYDTVENFNHYSLSYGYKNSITIIVFFNLV